LALVAVRRQALHERLRPGPLVMMVALVLIAGYPLQQFYMSHRYESVGAGSVGAPGTVAWAQGLENSRVALSGPFMILQYPYYGRNLSNYVQYVARVLPDGGQADYSSCRQWLRALHDGRYDYLITSSATEERWTRADPNAALIRTEPVLTDRVDVFKLEPALNLSGCNRASSSD
jgi:hypothetical protein